MIKTKRIAAIAAVSLAIVGGTNLYGASTIQKIAAQIDFSINMKVNNVDTQFKDGNKTIKPIVYNGRYYLPVDTVAQSLKGNYYFDKKSKTMYFGDRSGKASLFDLQANNFYWFDKTKDKELLTVGDKAYDYGLQGHDINSAEKVITFNTNGMYKKLYCSFAGKPNTSFKVIGDNDIVLKQGTLTDENKPVSVNIDITGQKTISFSVTGNIGANGTVLILEPYVTAK